MRYMAMHRTNASNEAGIPPSRELIDEMGKLVGELAQSGALLAGEGLDASSTGVRLVFSGGQCTRINGPFREPQGLIDGFLMLRLPTKDHAASWASRFATIVGDVEIDIRPVKEPWDLGLVPKPPDAVSRFVLTHKDRGGRTPVPQQASAMKALIAEMEQEGVFITAERLQPSDRSTRVQYTGSGRTVTDGPFAEAKELIAGYVMLRLDTTAEVIRFCDGFADVIGDVELDIRLLVDPE
jgi:hypothetical protein